MFLLMYILGGTTPSVLELAGLETTRSNDLKVSKRQLHAYCSAAVAIPK